MNNPSDAGSFEAVVPADEHGSSCLPVVAQAAVPAESCDLRARVVAALEEWRVLWKAGASTHQLIEAQSKCVTALLEYMAIKTHVGGNPELCSGGEAH